MNWRLKGLIQKGLSAVPGGVRLNDALQRSVGGLRHPERNMSMKVTQDWLVLARHMRELGMPLEGLRYMEVGTGWFPTLPACFLLAGARSVVSFDLTRHLDAGLTDTLWRHLETHLPAIAEVAGQPLDTVRARYAARPRPNVDYRAPADATRSGLADNSVDVVFSNSVLEHVPRPVIAGMLHEAHRVLRPGGLSIHSVNCADHYAYIDPDITFINYLTYTEADWTFWNNDLQYQNRMRPSDFVALSEQAGLTTVLSVHRPRPELLAALPSLNIAAEFRGYPEDQLCSTSVDFAGRKP